jgi:plasmid maintenance system antidote protein VapI
MGEDVLPGTGLTQGQARLPLVSRLTVNEILQERRPITTNMAHKLYKNAAKRK